MINQNLENKVGILLPFKPNDMGVFSTSNNITEQVKSNLLNLLLTIKGERVMQPEFGTNLYKYVFEQNTEDLHDDIVNEITIAIKTWLPYVIIKNIDVFYANDEDYRSNKITIKFSYSLSINRNFTDNITFKINSF